MKSCIFCKIANKEIPAEIVYENEKVMAFNDIHPKAKVHILIIPKIHIESILSKDSSEASKDLIEAAKHISEEKGLAGFKLLFNVGKEGGQSIDHLHLHLLAGDKFNLVDL